MDVLIVDDEALARQRLRRMLGALPGYRVAGEVGEGAQVLARAREQLPDIVLLDIHLPGTDGLQVATALAQWSTPPAIIFTTAHVEHALSAANLAVAGYLLKPVRQEELIQALSRARRLSRAQWHVLEGGQAAVDTRFLSVHSRAGPLRLPLDEVIFFRAEHKYTTVYHLHGELLIAEALTTLERRFGDVLLRIHREALVARRYIMMLENDGAGQAWLWLQHSYQALPVSRRRLAAVRRCLCNRNDNA